MKREGVISSAEISVLGPTSTQLVAPDHVLSEVVNMVQTLDGGLTNVNAPTPVVYEDTDGSVPGGPSEPPDITAPSYGTCYGIFHACIRGGERDILLLHTGDNLWELTGWTRSSGGGTTDAWSILVAPSGTTANLNLELQLPGSGDFPDQFVATPTGIIIIPAGGPVMFYDGDVILPLGYSEPPAPPIGHGPGSSSNQFFPDNTQPFFGVNDTGYTMDGLDGHPPSKMFPVWKGARIGTVNTPGNVTVLAESGKENLKSQVMGYLEPGLYRARVQYIDLWGNLSPQSGDSNDIEFRRQPAMKLTGPTGGPPPAYGLEWVHADLVRKQVAWDALPIGPDGTIGRIIGRTKDLVNSGDTKVYQLPRDAMVTPGAYATIPDNISVRYPDNIPDAWLQAEMLDVAPFPQCRLVDMGFGRAFYANAVGDEGAVFWSEIGRYGTILRKSKLYPDPSGSEITCVRRYMDGVFCFTESTLYSIVSNDAGDGFKPVPIRSTMGTLSPSTVRMHRNGMLIWLGSDGNFWGFDGTSAQLLWSDQRTRAPLVNRGRLRRAVAEFDERSGEYRCWVSTLGGDTSTVSNDRCYTFDGAVWRWRTDMSASGVCVTKDHRKLMIACGAVGAFPGPFVLDVGSSEVDTGAATYDPEDPATWTYLSDTAAAYIKTGWITSTSIDLKSVFTVYMRLRETGQPTSANRIVVKVRKNYRADVVDTHPIDASYAKLDTAFKSTAINPTLWDDGTVWGATAAKWRRRRPFWVKVDVNIQMAEAFQLEFYFADRTEILGFRFDEKPREVQGAMSQRGARS